MVKNTSFAGPRFKTTCSDYLKGRKVKNPKKSLFFSRISGIWPNISIYDMFCIFRPNSAFVEKVERNKSK